MTTLYLIVALTLAGVGVYIARRHPLWATPIMVGAAILTVLYIVWDHDQSQPHSVVPSAPSTTSAPAELPQVGPNGQIPGAGGTPPPPATTAWPPNSVPPSSVPGK